MKKIRMNPVQTSFRRARLRTQLLVTVNLFVVLLMAGFLYVDFQQITHAVLVEKSASLGDEARTIDAAVQELRVMGPDAVQRHIDTICASMNAQDSPGHTIEVTLDGNRLVSKATTHQHDHASPWSELVSGASTSDGVIVRVGERRRPLIAKVRKESLTRLSVLVGVSAIGALVLNLLLVRLVTRPLEKTTEAVREVGRGKLGTGVNVHSNFELTQLAQEVTQMSRELARRNSDRNAQIDRARRLQSHLIPQHISRRGIGIAIEFHPADEIAGDYVDVLECPNGDTLLCVADVVGHGIHAAMGSAVLKALLLTVDLNDLSPASMLTSINQRFCKATLPEDFASMILMRVTKDGDRMVYASAGHELGYLRKVNGACLELDSSGTVLGVDQDAQFDDIDRELAPGDQVILLSDGVSETFNAERNILGRDAVREIIQRPINSNANALAKEIVDRAASHRGDTPALDDMTVLVLKVEHTDAPNSVQACVDSSSHAHPTT